MSAATFVVHSLREEEMEFGTVKFFKFEPDKLFGFIRSDAGDDVFFHLHNCAIPESLGLNESPKWGDRIAFIRGDGKKGPKAIRWVPDGYEERLEPKPIASTLSDADFVAMTEEEILAGLEGMSPSAEDRSRAYESPVSPAHVTQRGEVVDTREVFASLREMINK